MKKVSKFFVVIALAGVFSACSNTDILEPESKNQMEDFIETDSYRSVEQAIDGLNFMLRHMGEEQKIHRQIKMLRVLNKSDVRPITRAEEDTPLAYVINFENEDGYAILGADKETAPVIVIGDHGSFDGEQYKRYLSQNKRRLYSGSWAPENNQMLDSLILESSEEDILEMQYLLITDALNVSFAEDLNATRAENVIVEYCAPLMMTRWAQGAPYNNEIDAELWRKPVGCATIALAQMLTCIADKRYLIHPVIGGRQIDWYSILEEIRKSPRVDGSTTLSKGAMAIVSLVEGCRKCLKVKYNETTGQSGASLLNIINGFQTLGYENVECEMYGNSLPFVRNMIFDNNLPIFTLGRVKTNSGIGHAFVTDGWLKENVISGTSSVEKNYVHCNFGNNGKCDGYYLAGNEFLESGKHSNFPENGDSDYARDMFGVQLIKFDKLGGLYDSTVSPSNPLLPQILGL